MEFLFLFSCGNRQPITGKVIERTEMDSQMLEIKYEYLYDGKYFIDSASFRNNAIVSDVILLDVDMKNSAKSTPIPGK